MINNRAFLAMGGLSGAAGVVLAAAAAHGRGGYDGTVSALLLAHAPVFLFLSIAPRTRLLSFGGLAILLGLLLFSIDLMMRQYMGQRLFPMASPIGGSLTILGWLVLAASSLAASKQENPAALSDREVF
ncbi:DUF423 domain-containing protein [Limoniibacter endophyticus]|uniref:DUF423 domain-containing protein n=1 Tax=Limoniibacter endophyticus TaxID=1565040 RepID=A0A8J3GGR9_9HYPH|nr:DUF423 domain-containing protein [Limoniibacter endophyticus]GHC70454.1 hypothetical protein GCM10010136_16770 [Limoniibacter endophyticus]